MNRVVANHEFEYQPFNAMARELGYDREAITFLGLSRLKGIGFQTLFTLDGRAGISRLIDGRNVAEIAGRVEQPMSAGKATPSWDEFSHKIWTLGQEMADKLVEQRVHFLFTSDPRFPTRLAGLPEDLRPKWLFVAGDLSLLERPALAIVGTRGPTKIGEFLAQYAVSAAKEVDAPVVSGLAEGIDRIVHEWCLNISLPTVSVLGNGHPCALPREAQHTQQSHRRRGRRRDERISSDAGAVGPAVCVEEPATGGPRAGHDPGRMEEKVGHRAYGQILAEARPPRDRLGG
jgi:predicted Rossmann fold nucleotide-binding protein DprA/Smf involved in DNA uptake